MGKVLSRGNVEMMQQIARGGGLTAAMWEHRDEDQIHLYRVCGETECFNTWMYCLAGGEYKALAQMVAPESVAVDQVGNNEGMPGRKGGVDPRLEMLAKLGITPSAPKKERLVVEYSWMPAKQFSGNLLSVGVNRKYAVKGSGLSFEGGGGVILQIGTPLSWVETEEENVDFTSRFI
ncbi:hypothetical protein [Longimicrobium sp.]|uniref:hypothetical protein n=1 Tax=Longimicrobium sp. TaxID=2029185 RepID=UPI002C0C4BB1|nr:hypothetical protein [Longimicrobium sp.]HSU15657.1 hypothetical protein [Longimicrobium sp.]